MFLDWKDIEKEQVLLLLKEVHGLFSNQANWIDWPIAVDSRSLEVSPDSDKAARWSLMGATEKFAGLRYPKPFCDFLAVASREFLNDLSDDKLIRGEFSYEDEVSIIELGIEELEK